MASHRWKVEHVPVGSQQSKMAFIYQIRPLVVQNRCITIRDLVDKVGIIIGSALCIATETRCAVSVCEVCQDRIFLLIDFLVRTNCFVRLQMHPT